MSHHLLGGGARIDPYMQAGYGWARADVNVSGTISGIVTGTAEFHYGLGAVTVQIATEDNAVVSELP